MAGHDTTIALPTLRWRTPVNQQPGNLCTHPPESVVADILEGDMQGTAVKWCRLCGAVMRVPTDGDRS